MNKPLADLLRPLKFEDVVGQKHLLDKDKVFFKVINNKKVPNMIFYGPPGVGKTTIANIVANNSNMAIFKLNGTTAKIEDIKKVIDEIDSLMYPNGILLYLDEIQYFNKKQQQTLLNYIENGEITLIASTTENPMFYIYPALLSRCTVFEFKSLSDEDIFNGLKKLFLSLDATIDIDALEILATSAHGDMRKALNNLEFVLNSLDDDKHIEKDLVLDLVNRSYFNYDKNDDEHFNTLSAFHKSIRGSDPDAAIFYLARLLEGGDIISASRRLLCIASEDIGMAYPLAAVITKSLVDSAFQLGLPEAKLPLSEATIFLATCPKSNSAYLSFASASKDVVSGKGLYIPRHLKNTHYDGEDTNQKGQNYLYPHDFKNNYVEQQYLPDDIKNHTYYTFQDNKYENTLKAYWKGIKK